MKFSHKYPDVVAGTEAEPSILLTALTGSCWICNARTNWVDIDFGAKICSEECEKLACENFREAYRK